MSAPTLDRAVPQAVVTDAEPDSELSRADGYELPEDYAYEDYAGFDPHFNGSLADEYEAELWRGRGVKVKQAPVKMDWSALDWSRGRAA